MQETKIPNQIINTWNPEVIKKICTCIYFQKARLV